MFQWLVACWRGVPDTPVVFGESGYTVVSHNAKGESRDGESRGDSMVSDGIFIVDTSGKRRQAREFHVYRNNRRLMRITVEGMSTSVPARVLIAAEDEVIEVPVASGRLQRDTNEDT